MCTIHWHWHTFVNPKTGGGTTQRNFPNVSNAFLQSRSTVSPDEFWLAWNLLTQIVSAPPRAEIILGLPGWCQSRLHPLVLAPSVPCAALVGSHCCPDPVRFDEHCETKQCWVWALPSVLGEQGCALSQERALGARSLRSTWALLRKEEMGREESACADGSSPPPMTQ